jgi:hypothetical protein
MHITRINYFSTVPICNFADKISLMKIAIPTNNSIEIAGSSENLNRFKVVTCRFGKIVSEEIRINGSMYDESTGKTLSDCDYLIVHNSVENPVLPNIEIVKTDEMILTNIETDFIAQTLKTKSDYTCAP